MKNRIVARGICIALFALNGAAIAADAPSLQNDATRLVRAAEIDRSGLFALQQAMRRGQKRNAGRAENEAEKTYYACVYSADFGQFTRIYAEQIAKAMSAEEMREVTQFYEGAVGRKQVARDFILIKEAFGTREPDEKLEQPTSEETSELEKFQASAAAKKFLGPSVLHSEALLQALSAKTSEMIKACAKLAKKDPAPAKQQ
jgi:hypothetical protein